MTVFWLIFPQQAKKRLSIINREGRECCEQGKYQGALQKYQSALKICMQYAHEPTFGGSTKAATVHSYISFVYLKMESPQKALEHAEECIQLNPEFAEVSHVLLTLYLFIALSLGPQHCVVKGLVIQNLILCILIIRT